MDTNTGKPDETGKEQVHSLQVALEWLDREGNRQKIPTALELLLESTLIAVKRGDAPPAKDAVSMVDKWRLQQQGHRELPDNPEPPRKSEFTRWWTARADHLRQTCLDAGCRWMPRLEVLPGGGRGNPTLYRFELDPIAPGNPDALDSSALPENLPEGSLRYRVDPLRPPVWNRMLIGSKPFPIRSWRGYALLASAALNFLLIGVILWSLAASWYLSPRPVTTAEVAQAMIAVAVSMLLWRATRPVRQLPSQRVTLANASFLRSDEFHGQLRAMHEGGSRRAGRTFSLVRHWGHCPICAAEVDLADGGRSFPGRIVGRCGDAPLEHVYSFDPVRLTGSPLREAP